MPEFQHLGQNAAGDEVTPAAARDQQTMKPPTETGGTAKETRN